MPTTSWDLGQRSSTTSGLSTTRSGTGHFRSAIGWSTFERRYNVPKQLSPEFLLVDLVNELDQLAEDRGAIFSRVREKAKEMDPKRLSRAVSLYGEYSTQKKFQKMLLYAT